MCLFKLQNNGTESQVGSLKKKSGFYLLAIWQCAGYRIGLNPITITVALPASIEKWFYYFRVGDGLEALGAGMTGSAQGAEAKHADTKLQALMTSGRAGWTLKMIWNECLRAFGVLMIPAANVLKPADVSTANYKYPPAVEFKEIAHPTRKNPERRAGKYYGHCATCFELLSDKNKAELSYHPPGAAESLVSEYLAHDPLDSCTGKLNYQPNEFEKTFLKYDEGNCCKDCAIALDYIREVAYTGCYTGIWLQIQNANLDSTCKLSMALNAAGRAINAASRNEQRAKKSVSDAAEAEIDGDLSREQPAPGRCSQGRRQGGVRSPGKLQIAIRNGRTSR
jgi:hypothetical protein